jgi:hypothetical protein
VPAGAQNCYASEDADKALITFHGPSVTSYKPLEVANNYAKEACAYLKDSPHQSRVSYLLLAKELRS